MDSIGDDVEKYSNGSPDSCIALRSAVRSKAALLMEQSVVMVHVTPSSNNDSNINSPTVLLETGYQTTSLLQWLRATSLHNHTIVGALSLQIQSENLPAASMKDFLAICKQFFASSESDPAKHVLSEIVQVSRSMAVVALRLQKPLSVVLALRQAVALLGKALSSYSSSSSSSFFSSNFVNANAAAVAVCLTPAHMHLLEVLIAGQMYREAAKFVRENPIFELDLGKTSLCVLDFLKYYYYAGISFIAVRDYRSAIDSFLTAVCTPANVLSAVAVQSLKKLRLLSLLDSGAPFLLPLYAPTVATKFCGEEMPVYDDIVKAFIAGKEDRLREIIADGEFLLTADKNYGLAMQVLRALPAWKMKKLTNVYLALPLADIAARIVGPAAAAGERGLGGTLHTKGTESNTESTHDLDVQSTTNTAPAEASAAADVAAVERMLVNLIMKGEINARIDRVNSIVYFDEHRLPTHSPSPSSISGSSAAGGRDSAVETELEAADAELQLIEHLSGTMQEMLSLSARLRCMQERILASPQYIAKRCPAYKGTVGGGGGVGGGVDMQGFSYEDSAGVYEGEEDMEY